MKKLLLHIDKDLTGDGRRLYYPNPDIDKFANGVKGPIPLSKIRFAVQALTDNGRTKHSPRGELMWCLQEWCRLNKYDWSAVVEIRHDPTVSADRVSKSEDFETAGYTFTLGYKQP